MAGYVLFISENRLKEATAINGNVDADYLLPYVRVAQKKYMETKLGTKLFNKLKDLITAGTVGDVGNENYKILLNDYIADPLVHWGFFECIPFLRYKVQNGEYLQQNIRKRYCPKQGGRPRFKRGSQKYS